MKKNKMWLIFRDRFRTMINVLGDALAAGIMAHVCRKDFETAAAEQSPASSNGMGSKRVSKRNAIC